MSARAAIIIIYACFGALLGLWGGSVAEVSRLAQSDAATQGIAITVFGIAGIVGMMFAGRIAVSVSVRTRMIAYFLLEGLALAVLLHAGSAAALIVGIFFFSMLAAAADLAMNAEGIAIEQDYGRATLSRFHAASSIGAASGAIAGSFVSVSFGVSATALLAALLVALSIALIVSCIEDRGPTETAGSGSTWFRPSVPLMVIAVVVGVSIACEIGAMLFSTQTLVAQAPAFAAFAGSAGMVHSLLQASVRYFGDGLRDTYGDRKVVRGSLALLTFGLLVVTFSGHPAQSILGFALIGAGTACLVPCGFALAKRYSGRSAAAAISMVSVIGGPFRIVAPFAYGTVAASTGFASGYGVYAAMALAAAILAFALLEKPAKVTTP